MWFILAFLILLVYARKIFAAGYQYGNNDATYRVREVFDQVRTPEDFEQMMKSYRHFYMKEEHDRRNLR